VSIDKHVGFYQGGREPLQEAKIQQRLKEESKREKDREYYKM
jgi:hypothetical protein